MSKRTVVVTAAISLAVLVFFFGPLCYLTWTRWDATIYATGFSETGFRQIREGMTKADVERILGKPLTNKPGCVEGMIEDETRWRYSWFDCAKIPHHDRVTNTWFQVREVDFDGSGRVKTLLSSTEQFE